jgi:isopentenyl-diphosphate delta-isomerase
VDEKDNVVGHDSKYNCHLMEKIEAENLLHRAFSVFLFNSKNELLLQKRSATKVTFPLVWTNACCSHPLYRESELIQEGHLGMMFTRKPSAWLSFPGRKRRSEI